MEQCVISMFPGQGAQFSGMGLELLRKYEYHSRLADQTLGYSLVSVCEGRFGDLNSTEFTQPALFVVNILQYLDSLRAQAAPANVFAGHSLGEYCALFAAGAFSFSTALRIVQERGRCMASCKNGSMSAVLGLTLEQVEHLLQESEFASLSIANFNAPTQYVISGDRVELENFEPLVVDVGGSLYPLNVNSAFHSARMADIAARFEQFLSTAEVYPLRVAVLSNATADYYPMNSREQLIDLLVRQLYSPVLWQQCMERLPAETEIVCMEHGPKPVLTKLARQILRSRAILAESS